MAKKKARGRKPKIPLLTVLGIAAGAWDAWNATAGNMNELPGWLSVKYLGYNPRDGNFDLRQARGLHLLILGGLASIIVNVLIGRRIRMPYVRF